MGVDTDMVGSYEFDLLCWVVGPCRPMSGVGSEQTTSHADVRPLHVIHAFKCPLAPQFLHSLHDQRIRPANIHQIKLNHLYLYTTYLKLIQECLQ